MSFKALHSSLYSALQTQQPVSQLIQCHWQLPICEINTWQSQGATELGWKHRLVGAGWGEAIFPNSLVDRVGIEPATSPYLGARSATTATGREA